MPDDRRGSQPMTPWQAWLSSIRAPLSGDVTRDIAASIGGQLGLFNINATRSGDPALEQRIITQVASYGRQLGRLVDAVDVLTRRQPRRGLGAASVRRTSARWTSSTTSPSGSRRSSSRPRSTRSTASSSRCRR